MNVFCNVLIYLSNCLYGIHCKIHHPKTITWSHSILFYSLNERNYCNHSTGNHGEEIHSTAFYELVTDYYLVTV